MRITWPLILLLAGCTPPHAPPPPPVLTYCPPAPPAPPPLPRIVSRFRLAAAYDRLDIARLAERKRGDACAQRAYEAERALER